MDGTLDPKPKRGPDVKIIIQSLEMHPVPEQNTVVPRINACNPAKMFKSVIQHANDSGSLDTSLEYKSLTIVHKKNALLHIRKIPYDDELRAILKENKIVHSNSVMRKVDETDSPVSKLPFANKKNLPQTRVNLKIKPKNDRNMPTMCEKWFDTLKFSKNMPASSTPYRPKQNSDTNINNNCKREIDLMTSSADVRFIDSDNEGTDGDFNKTLIKCYSLTRASCHRMSSFRKPFRKQDCKSDIQISNSPKLERRSLFSSSFNVAVNRSSIISTTEISPLRRQRNIKIKNSKLLNFFRPSKINTLNCETQHENDLTKTCSNLTELLVKSDENSEELGCMPLLTRDNIDFHTEKDEDMDDCDKTIDCCNKLEFSYICEPSTSDIDEEDELEYFPTANTKSSIVPYFNITPPSISSCEIYEVKKNNMYNINSSHIRRSISDPALIKLVTVYSRSNSCLNNDFNDPLDFYSYAPENIVSDLSSNFKYQ